MLETASGKDVPRGLHVDVIVFHRAGGRAVRRFQVAAEPDGTVPNWASVAHNGNVILERRLDYEALEDKVLTLRVQAVSDDHRRTSTATLQVQVLDANDHTPQFGELVSS